MFSLNNIYLSFPFSNSLSWRPSYFPFEADLYLAMLPFFKQSIEVFKSDRENETLLKHYSDEFKLEYSKEILINENNLTKSDLINFQQSNEISTTSFTKISASPFFDHIVNFFDHKIFNDDLENNFINFWDLKQLNYTNLKIVTYSGHDYNFIGIFKNLLHPKTLEIYLNNVEKYRDFVIFPFASNMDFHLIKNNKDGKFYVRIFVNGKEILEKVRSGTLDENGNEMEIDYNLKTGLEYKTFRTILSSRIFEKYDECIHTIKKKKKKNK